MVFEAFFQALQTFGNFHVWPALGLGVVLGLVVGILPGIGTVLALSLMLPFVVTIGPAIALPMMIAILWCNPIGSTITTILVGVPGSTGSVATLVDGYPMTKNGEAARALGAGLTSSGLAGIFGVVISIAVVPLVLPLIYAIDSRDMVILILMGLAFISTLSQGSAVKGILGGLIGIIMAMIGLHVTTGEFRFTFGSGYLTGGLPLAAVAMGLFALPEVFEAAIEKETTVRTFKKGALGLAAVFVGVKDVFRHGWLWFRCLIFGWLIGVMPGVGGSTAAWICYAHAKQTSKNPETFGTGRVEGVIAPEVATNAENTGALLTTLALGIPGSAVMVLILAAMEVMNIIPGPAMLTTNLALTFSTMQMGIAAAFIGGITCILLAPYLAKVASVPVRILVPVITAAILIGAYADDGLYMDMIVLLVFGAIGILMREYGFNRPAMLLGFVMGDIFEKYLFLSVAAFGPLFFTKPLTVCLIIATILLFSWEPVTKKIKARKLAKEAQTR